MTPRKSRARARILQLNQGSAIQLIPLRNSTWREPRPVTSFAQLRHFCLFLEQKFPPAGPQELVGGPAGGNL
jgi:hypothetical protein